MIFWPNFFDLNKPLSIEIPIKINQNYQFQTNISTIKFPKMFFRYFDRLHRRPRISRHFHGRRTDQPGFTGRGEIIRQNRTTSQTQNPTDKTEY